MDASTSGGASIVNASLFFKKIISFRVWMVVVRRWRRQWWCGVMEGVMVVGQQRHNWWWWWCGDVDEVKEGEKEIR